MSLPYFPMYPADFEADTSHLTLEEDGAYNRLLRLMWMTPGCSLPDDDQWIMRRMRADFDTYESVVKPLIAEFFKREKGRLFSPRLMREFDALSETREKRSQAGKKGGLAGKPLKTNKTDESPAKARPKHARGIPEPEPDIDISSEDKSSSDICSAPIRAPKTELAPRAELQRVLDPERADAVLKHRQRIRKPLTSRAARLLAEKFAAAADPNKAADLMLERGWQGFDIGWAGAEVVQAKPTETDEAKWKARLEYARRTGLWPVAEWGQIPGRQGCMVPKALLVDGDGREWQDRRAA